MSANNFVVITLIIVALVAWKGFFKVPEHQRLVVFRLGRKIEKPKGPGLVFIIPMIDRVRVVDTSELENEIPNVSSVTKDSIPVLVTLRYRSMVFNLEKFIPAIGNWEEKNVDPIIDTIFKLVGEIDSPELPDKIEYLNRMLRFHLDKITRPYGVMITNVAITNLVIDNRLEQIYEAKISIGTIGEAQSLIDGTGTVLLDNKPWDAISDNPIAPKTKVRIKRVILEVEEE